MRATSRLTVLGLLLLASSLPVGAAQDETISVSGQVLLPGGEPAADVPVTLEIHDGQNVVFSRQASSDASGSVAWNDVPAGLDNQARIGAAYAGVVYYSDPQPVAPGTTPAFTVQVAPVTSEGRPLHIETLHLIVQVDDPGVYRVLEFMTVDNASESAFAGGPELADGRRAGIILPLPVGARTVRPAPFPTPEDALTLADAEIGTDRVLDGRPVPPEGRQIAVTYDLVSDGEPVAARLALPYPAQSVTLLVGGAAAEAVEITDTNLESRPTEQIGDNSYELWAADAVQPGTEIVFTIGERKSPLSAQNWALIGLGVSFVLAFAGSLYGGNLRHEEGTFDDLVHEVAALDNDHEAGRVRSGEYFQRRGEAIERLMLLEAQLERHGSHPANDDSLDSDGDEARE